MRRGAIETLELLSRAAPSTMAFLLPRLHDLLANEPAERLRTGALTILTNYAKTGFTAARRVTPIVGSTIDRFGARSAAKSLDALAQIAKAVPRAGNETLRIAERFQASVASTVARAAKSVAATVAVAAVAATAGAASATRSSVARKRSAAAKDKSESAPKRKKRGA